MCAADLAKDDPKHAITAMPEVFTAFVIGLLSFLGALGSLLGLIGAKKPVVQVKKTATVSSKVEKKGPAAPAVVVSEKEQVALDKAGVATGAEVKAGQASKRTNAGKQD